MNNQQAPKTGKEAIEPVDPFSPKPPAAEVPAKIIEAEPPVEIRKEVPKPEAEKMPQPEKEAPEAAVQPAPPPPPSVPAEPAEIKSEQLIQIESILEEDLKDTYFKLDPKIRGKFQSEGEKTAKKIEILLKEAKVKTHKIFKAIYDWLKIIPGVNKFFLRQEAKIKTDKILKIK